MRALRTVSTLLAAAALVAGCRRAPVPGFRLQEAVASADRGRSLGLVLPANARQSRLSYDLEDRHVVVTPLSGWSWSGRVPEGARLGIGCQLLPELWTHLKGVEAVVEVEHEGRREIAEIGHLRGRTADRWLDFGVDLARWAGETVTVRVRVDAPKLRLGADQPAVGWGPAEMGSDASRAERPNILFILVDTLRADRVQAYGSPHATTPEIQRWIAERGVTVEHAYSQAPWTLPSVVSFMTGIEPGELLGSDVSRYGLPPNAEVLAERMAAAGYETGGFVGNPTLHAGIGFDRGFGSFFVPGATLQSMRLHADEVTRRAIPWLAAHRARPFFAYLHYIDPHDPYESPEVVDGRTPFYPGVYTGPLSGQYVHGVYIGRYEAKTPEDVAYLAALYESEVHYVDRNIGEVLASIPPEVLANTLVVLTADHGEELHDHGGWKHGQTLYDEQIHVPLLFRWDGRLPAGRRLPGTVRLLDLLPTLSAAAGQAPLAAWQGIDLGPALRGERAVPRLPAFSQHLSSGPLRAAAVLDGRKLILFNRNQPFAPADGLQAYLWKQDLGRLARTELYDLAKDPHEQHNLYAGSEPVLEPIVQTELERTLPAGLRVLVAGVPPGERVVARIRVERPAAAAAPAVATTAPVPPTVPSSAGGSPAPPAGPIPGTAPAVAPATPAGAFPYYLGDDDRYGWDGTTLVLDVAGDTLAKGIVIPGEVEAVTLEELKRVGGAAGGAGAPGTVTATIGTGTPWHGDRAGRTLLRADALPAPGPGATLRVFWGSGSAAPPLPSSPETVRRLRALGYVQ